MGGLKNPLVADLNNHISKEYDDLADMRIAVRGIILIDTECVVQHQLVNNLPLGRNVDEALRMVDALQYHEKNGEVCPANWSEGADGMKPDPKGSQEYFNKHN